MTSPVSAQSRPTVKCKTCAKEFGRSSIKFHEPQCERKKNAEESRKDKEKNEGEERTVSYIDHIGIKISIKLFKYIFFFLSSLYLFF